MKEMRGEKYRRQGIAGGIGASAIASCDGYLLSARNFS
jgi:hypothetical protein